MFEIEIYTMRIIQICTFLLLASTSLFAQEFSLYGKIDGMEDGDVILGYYYGEKQYALDTVQAKNQFFHFDAVEAVKAGMYFILLPNQRFFQLVIDKDQDFTLETSMNDLIGEMKIADSEENQKFYDYQQFTQLKGLEVEPIKQDLSSLEEGSRKAEKLLAKIDILNLEVEAYKKQFMAASPEMFFVKLLEAMVPIEIPVIDEEVNPNGRYIYFKEHYWDHFDLSDDRMVRSPIFHSRMQQYIVEYTPQVADSIIATLDVLLAKVRNSDELFKYVLNWSTYKYESSKIMGHDAVFVDLVFKYYVTQQAPWVDEVKLVNIIDKAMRIKPNLIGTRAPHLALKDDKGEVQVMNDIEAPLTVLFFYDPDCGHCKKETPNVRDAAALYKDLGVKVYAICTEFDDEMWKDFITEYEVDDWINVIDLENESNFRGKYNVMGTPRLFVLDEEKTILAKQIDSEALLTIFEKELGIEE